MLDTLVSDAALDADSHTAASNPARNQALSDAMRKRCNSIAFMQESYYERSGHAVPVTLAGGPYIQSICAKGDKGRQ